MVAVALANKTARIAGLQTARKAQPIVYVEFWPKLGPRKLGIYGKTVAEQALAGRRLYRHVVLSSTKSKGYCFLHENA